MKKYILFIAVMALSVPVSLVGQNETALEKFKKERETQSDSFRKNREREYEEFKGRYEKAFARYKRLYEAFLHEDMALVELMSSDDGLEIKPLPAGVAAPQVVTSAKEQKIIIEESIRKISSMRSETMVSELSQAKDTVVQMSQAAEKMERIVENMEVTLAPYDPTMVFDEEEGQKSGSSLQKRDETDDERTYTGDNNVPSGKPTAYKRISSPFGTRVHPITRKRHTHKGVDLAAPGMTPIYATADGKVTFAKYNGGYGNLVKINHLNGYKTAYAHMKKIAVSDGADVKKGDLIGYVGTTGRSTGNHLHYEVYYNDGLIDPAKTL